MRAILVLCGISLLWGSGWMVAPLLGETTAPFAGAALLFAIAACLLTPWAFLSRSGTGVSPGGSVVLGVAMLGLPGVLLLLAAEHGVSGWVPLLYSLLPLFAALDRRSAAIVCAPGAVLVLLNGTVPFTSGTLAWATLALAAVISQAWALRYAARILAGCCLTAALLRSLRVQCALAAAVLAGASLWFDHEPRIVPIAGWPAASVFALLVMGGAVTALPYAGLYWLLSRSGHERALRPEQIATTQWLQFLIAAAESAALAHARLRWPLLLAAAALLGCTAVVLWARVDAQDGPVTLSTPSVP